MKEKYGPFIGNEKWGQGLSPSRGLRCLQGRPLWQLNEKSGHLEKFKASNVGPVLPIQCTGTAKNEIHGGWHTEL